MKRVNIEFFDVEPIENFITCLNYRMDKIFFVGFAKTMTEEKQNRAKRFLKDICGVEEVYFEPVEEDSLEQMTGKVEDILKKEKEQGNLCYIDLTGGEELILTAFGMVCSKYHFPIHRYKVEKNELVSFHNGSQYEIVTDGVKHNIKLKIDDILALYGGCINYRKQKSYKVNVDDEELKEDIVKMWEIVRNNSTKWNVFSSILKDCKKYKNDQNIVVIPKKTWDEVIASKSNISKGEVEKYLKELKSLKAMEWTMKKGNIVSYSFKNDNIENCILDAGCLLEMITYYNRKSAYKNSDVRVGVQLDWDGVVHTKEKDVENEVDVMVLDQYVLRFISCKSGEVSPVALYELDTIAEELGGKYVQKELVVGTKVSQVLQKRAKQMNITIHNACV